MMILRRCGSGVRFQVFDRLFGSHSFAIKLSLTNDDSEALWLRLRFQVFDSLFRSHSFVIELCLTNDDSAALWLRGQISSF